LPDGPVATFASYTPWGIFRLVGLDTVRWSIESCARSAVDAFEKMSSKPDAIFAHFLLPAGLAASRISKLSGIPAFCSIGESRCGQWFNAMTPVEVRDLLSTFRCVFPVSNDIARFLTSRCELSAKNIQVVANGVDKELFRRIDRLEARRKLVGSAKTKIL